MHGHPEALGGYPRGLPCIFCHLLVPGLSLLLPWCSLGALMLTPSAWSQPTSCSSQGGPPRVRLKCKTSPSLSGSCGTEMDCDFHRDASGHEQARPCPPASHHAGPFHPDPFEPGPCPQEHLPVASLLQSADLECHRAGAHRGWGWFLLVLHQRVLFSG